MLCREKYSKGMVNIDIEGMLKQQPDDGGVPKMKIQGLKNPTLLGYPPYTMEP